MLKRFAILAAVSFAVAAVPAHDQLNGKHPTSQSQQSQIEPPAPVVAPGISNQATSDHQQDPKDRAQGWHKLVTWPEGITAWLVMLTFGAIVWQAWETRKAAEAARDGIRLQETAYSQWVAFSNWSVEFREERHQLRIRVEIVNQTAFPLTLNRASITFGDRPNTVTVTLGEDFFLAPQLPYLVDVDLHVYNDEVRAFDGGYFGIMVTGTITHTGALERRATQEIGGTLVSGRGNLARFDAFVPMHPHEANPATDPNE
jgi:hypothetical protein